MYTSLTVYQDVAAVRIAVNNWGTQLHLDREEVEDGRYQGDGDRDWNAQEPKRMTYYKIVRETLKTVMVDPPGFVRELRG